MYKSFKKDNLSWDDLSRVLYGTPDKAGNLAKMNNDTDCETVIVPSDEIFEVAGENIRCSIEDVTYTHFQYAYTLNKLGGVRGAVFIFTYEPEKHKFKKKQRACVYDENGLFFKGAVFDGYPVTDESGRMYQLEVRSDVGVLIDSCVPHPLEFDYCSLKAVIQRICDYYSIEVAFDNDVGLDYVYTNEIGNSFAAELNEKCWDFLCRITSARGYMLTDTGGTLYVGKIKETEAKISFNEGEAVGVTSWKSIGNSTGLCRYYEIHTQHPEPTVACAVVPIEYPTICRGIKPDSADGTLQEYTNWYACRCIGKAYKYELCINDNLPIYAGDFVNFKSESCNVFDSQKMIIEDKRANYPVGNIITLTLPCAYTGIIPKELP